MARQLEVQLDAMEQYLERITDPGDRKRLRQSATLVRQKLDDAMLSFDAKIRTLPRLRKPR
jgi:hypothetical protein